jgi:hypothetical protein
MFEIDGAVAGLDLFDKETTLAKVLPKLVRSFALDAVEDSSDQKPDESDERATQFVGLVAQAGVEQFPAVGLGEDLRLSGRAVSGGGLYVDGAIVHLFAFPGQAARTREAPDRIRSRIHRASIRRRHH